MEVLSFIADVTSAPHLLTTSGLCGNKRIPAMSAEEATKASWSTIACLMNRSTCGIIDALITCDIVTLVA